MKPQQRVLSISTYYETYIFLLITNDRIKRIWSVWLNFCFK